jgi:hypothetical protein
MGGNAFGITLPRINKKNYNNTINEINEILVTNNIINFHNLKPISEKLDFGDIDYLISNEYNSINLKSIFNIPNLKTTNNNGVFSILYKHIQIDFVYVNWDKIETIKIFYDYNDLGNLIGRLAKYYYCVFKPDGLYFKIYSEDKSRKLGEVLLSDNIKEIFNFLDLDYNKYEQGFETYKEAFDFIIKSKLMYIGYYKHKDYVNSKALRRDMVRKTFNKFLHYIHNMPSTEKPIRPDFISTLNILDGTFKDSKVKEIYFQLKEKERITELNKKAFNGNLVMKLTGLKGIELGEFIKYFKCNYIDKLDKEIYKVNKLWIIIQIYIYYFKLKIRENLFFINL